MDIAFQAYAAMIRDFPELALDKTIPLLSVRLPYHDGHILPLPSVEAAQDTEGYRLLQQAATGIDKQLIAHFMSCPCYGCVSTGTANCRAMAFLLEFRTPPPSPSPRLHTDLRSFSPRTPMDAVTATKTVCLHLLARFRMPSEVRDILKGFYTAITAEPINYDLLYYLRLELWRHNLTFATQHYWIMDLDEDLGLVLTSEGDGIDHEEGPRQVEVPSIEVGEDDEEGDTATWLHTLEEILAYQPPAMGMPGITTALTLLTNTYVVFLYPKTDPI
jgi:hypothetical protein